MALTAILSLACGVAAERRVASDVKMLPPLAGIGAADPRIRVDPEQGPWRAVGKLQAAALNLRVLCTATLIGPATVLTAAHCLYNPRTRYAFVPGSLHFLIGYAGGRYAGHAVGVRIKIGDGYDPERPRQTIGSDWALVTLDEPPDAADRALPVLREPPETQARVMLGGYQQDHPLILMADTHCRIEGRVADASGRTLLRHNCAGTHGVSGAPLLIESDGRWAVAAIDVAAETGAEGGLAVMPGAAANGF
ncbi:MAG: trypsin-like serine protease [Stellaceae bacterium]